MADNRRQDEFTFELPAVEFRNSDSRSGDKFQGKNSATVSPDHGCHSIRSRQTCSRWLITHLTRKSPETGITPAARLPTLARMDSPDAYG